MFRSTYSSTVICLVLGMCSSTAGQWTDFSGNLVYNPGSSVSLQPRVVYNRVTGMFWVDTAGANGIADSECDPVLGCTEARGDDVGLIAMFIMPLRPGISQPGPALGGLIDGVEWRFDSNFDNTRDIVGIPQTGYFLWPTSTQDLIQFDETDLTADDFRVTIRVNFDTSGNTATIIDPVIVVPEPHIYSMLVPLALLLVSKRRKGRGARTLGASICDGVD